MLVPQRGGVSATHIISHTLAHKQTPTTHRHANADNPHSADPIGTPNTALTMLRVALSLSHSLTLSLWLTGWRTQKEAGYKFNYDAGIHTHHYAHSYVLHIFIYTACVCHTHISIQGWAR